MRATVYVSLKEGVLDPQGKAVHRSLATLGFEEVRGVRIGRAITLEVEGTDRAQAEARLEEMCQKLLANPVIEDYRVELEG